MLEYKSFIRLAAPTTATNTKMFFANEATQRLITGVLKKMDTVPVTGDLYPQIKGHTHQILHFMSISPQEWDEFCPHNIEVIDHSLLRVLEKVLSEEGSSLQEHITTLYVICFRFLAEPYFNIGGKLADELRPAYQFAYRNFGSWSIEAKEQILYALHAMPLDLLKKGKNEEAIVKLKNWADTSNRTDAKIKEWEEKLANQENRASALHQALKKYESAYNFVGLHQGFESLSNEKEKQLRKQRAWLVFFGLLLPLPFISTLTVIAAKLDNVGLLKDYALLASIPLASITIILLYFFRIALANTNSTKSQLLQIELRKTLCKFIQSYANYSKEIKDKNPDSLSKFESIIFSSIVSSDDKIPSTFDGLEQVSGIIKAIRGKD